MALHKTLTYESVDAWLDFFVYCQQLWERWKQDHPQEEDLVGYLQECAQIARRMRFSLAEGNRYTEGFPLVLKHLNPRLLAVYEQTSREDILQSPSTETERISL